MFRSMLLAVVLLAGVSLPAQADFLLGAKTGPMLVGFDNAESDGNPINAGVMFGYEIGVGFGDVAFEAEITRSLSAGSIEQTDLDLEVESQGVYVSFTTAGPIYFKARLGLMDAALVAGDLSEDEGGETYGVGVGLSLALIRLELEYTSIDDDVAFVSAGIVYPF